MKRQHLSLMAAVPVALLFACAAGAQQTPPETQQPQPQTQQTPPMQQTPPTTSAQTMQCANGGNCYDNSTTDRDTSATTGNRNGTRKGSQFSSLAGSKGYVSESDTAGHQWLASHFSQCDSNHNDKLSRAEYRHCRQAYGQGQQ